MDKLAERLQKLLARAGFGSRRACEELIVAGRVLVNGRTAELGMRADESSDVVEVDGLRVYFDRPIVYYVLNKPVDVVTTAKDTHGRPTVLELVPSEPRVFAVGRLDRDTSGLLLLTNDGDFALRMTHPRYGVPKVYVAQVDGTATRGHVRALTAGLELEDGEVKAERAVVRASQGGHSVVEVEVREGRKRMVRRMLDAVGLPVRTLTRVAFGPLRIEGMRPGEWRALTRDEVLALLASARREASVD